MMMTRLCEEPDCSKAATWFMGREFETAEGPHSRGHCSCDVHLAQGCRVTLLQLHAEGETDAMLQVRPVGAVLELT